MNEKKRTEKVLLYLLPESDPKGHAIRGYLKEHDIPVLTATPMDSGRTLAAIFGLAKGNMGRATPLPKEPVLVMFGFSEETLDPFLEFLRDNAPVPLKAVATPHNLKWPFGQLAAQLMRERAFQTK